MMSMNRIYLAGPMTGLPESNFPAFRDAAGRLRDAGWEVINPAENFGGRTDLPRSSYLRADLSLLLQCGAMALLPGWEDSQGAKLEYAIARELDMTLLDADTLEPLADPPSAMVVVHSPARARAVLSEGVLIEAQRITGGDRQRDYGHPLADFSRTAALWNALLAGRLREGKSIESADVPLFMIAVKLARQVHGYKRDNLVDIAGYARTAALVEGDE